MVFYEDQTIHDIQYKKPKTIMVQNSGEEIPQWDIEPYHIAQSHHMEQPNQIDQGQEI